MKPHSQLILALILTLAFAADAQAYSSYMSRIPNTPNSCNTCHSYGGGSPRNAFGLAFDGNGLVWTDALANADSDSDGQSNGEELGDPCGIWSQGETPARSNDLSNPGDVGSTSADGMAGSLLWFFDNDGDQVGDDDTTQQSCTAPDGYVAVGGDCNDGDSGLGAISADLDCDGLLNDADDDADGDSVASADDCDDADASLGATSADLDCDGLLNDADDDVDGDSFASADDCDDTDASLGATSADLDCDGLLNDSDDDADGDSVAKADDCDDADASLGATSADLDCDGLLNDADDDADGDSVASVDDCDDTDASYGAVTADLDCDGLLNDADDDADGDSVTFADDCDDTDDGLGATSADLDCDGLLNDTDDDADGDGAIANDDCDDANADYQTASTCEELAETCGVHADNCGGLLNCGACDEAFDAGSVWVADAGSEIAANLDAGSGTESAMDAGTFSEPIQDSGVPDEIDTDAGGTTENSAADGGVTGVIVETDGGGVETGVSIDAQVTITAPAAGEEVEGPWVTIEFSVTGCQISNPNQNPDGCHLRKWLDDEAYSDPSGGGERHYAPMPMAVFIDSGGSHTFKAVLMRNDGSDEAYVPEVSGSVTFELPSTASGSGDSDGEGGTDTADYQAPARTPSGETGGCACTAQNSGPSTFSGLVFLGMALGLARRRRMRF